MTDTDNAYKAKGTSPHEAFDFIAYPGEKPTWAPTWGFDTCFKDPGTSVKGIKEVFLRGDSPLFRFGGSFGGWVYGAAAHGGSPDDKGNVGPQVNSYSDFAGVFGTGIYVTGVAGTSVNNVGVYGQTGEDPDSRIPGYISTGVFGAGGDDGAGVFGWSTKGQGVVGLAFEDSAVSGTSHNGYGVAGYSERSPGVQGDSANYFGVVGISYIGGPTIPDPVTLAGVWGSSNDRHGVIGTSTAKVGVYGYSTNSVGIFGMTTNPASYAGVFAGNVSVVGTLNAVVKNGVVPFPDGSRRVLHCMESPDHWFEDFGSAKLARSRGRKDRCELRQGDQAR